MVGLRDGVFFVKSADNVEFLLSLGGLIGLRDLVESIYTKNGEL